MQNSTVPSHLAIGHRWSGQHHLDCFTVSLQFQGWSVGISSWPVLRTAAAFVTAAGWSSCH